MRGGKTPLVGLQLVEALVVEHSHQTGSSRTFVRLGDRQRPLFLLTGSQSVAEGCPLHFHPLVRHRTHDGLLVHIAAAVLDPRIGEQQAIMILLLILELAVQQRAV